MKDKPPFANAEAGNKFFFSDRKTFEVTDNMRRVYKKKKHLFIFRKKNQNQK